VTCDIVVSNAFSYFFQFQTPVTSVRTDKYVRSRKRSSVVRRIGSLLPLRPARRVRFHVSAAIHFKRCTFSGSIEQYASTTC